MELLCAPLSAFRDVCPASAVVAPLCCWEGLPWSLELLCEALEDCELEGLDVEEAVCEDCDCELEGELDDELLDEGLEEAVELEDDDELEELEELDELDEGDGGEVLDDCVGGVTQAALNSSTPAIDA